MHHWGIFPPLGFLAFCLLVGLFIANIIMWRRRGGMCHRGTDHAIAILERRLASGEIETEEFTKLKELLEK